MNADLEKESGETARAGDMTSLKNKNLQDAAANSNELQDEMNKISAPRNPVLQEKINDLCSINEALNDSEHSVQQNENVENEEMVTGLQSEAQKVKVAQISSTIGDLKAIKNSDQQGGETMETSIKDGEVINAENSGQQGLEAGDSAKVDKVDATKTADKEAQIKSSNDPYAYVDRADFTSEKFKIEIRGLPKFYGYGELKRFLNDKLKLSSHKVKPTRKKSPWVFVCFKNEEDRQAAIKTLNRLTWKGKMLTASTAKPAPDPLVKKRKLEHESGNVEKKPRISDDERLKNSTTPYWNLSYEEQLKRKFEYVKNIMCNLADLITSVNPMLTLWIRRQKAKYNGMACNMLDIRKSPNSDGYRNKCEFTIGINEETKQRMVGFRLGSYVQGHVGVGPIDSLKHIPQRMKETVKVFEKFVQASTKEPYNPETHMGHWRLLTLRLTTLGELMAVVVVNSKGVAQAELASAKEEVKDFFENGKGKALRVNSLYFQAVGKREAGKEPPMEHILGATHITESLLGLKFRISPEAFFQVNTPGAGVLYSSVGEMIDLNPSTTIVDVCCGTGTIGLSLAKKCGQVLGLEVVAPAIEDAKVNATENNITNCEFFTGRAEEILTSVLSRAKGKSVYAIVDPPRSGLQQKGIIALRGAEIVEQIVYVSCDPNAALKNFVDLARQTSKTYHGFPLVPVCAVPVDMFPHTAHCEVIILFHRLNPNNLPKSLLIKKSDTALLSESLTKSPSKQSKLDELAKKDEDKTEAKKEKSISDTPNTKNLKKNTFPVMGTSQGKRFKRMLASSGGGRSGRGFIHDGKDSTSKTGKKQGFSSRSNASYTSKVDTVEPRRGRKRTFDHERMNKAVGQLWKEKSPQPWLDNESKRRWKENESFGKNVGVLWKDGQWMHSQKDRGVLPEEVYETSALHSGRINWKEGTSERESRDWSASSHLESKWHGMGSRRRGNGSPMEEVERGREGWSRGVKDGVVEEQKRWREDRSGMVEGQMNERRKLTREDEQLMMGRSGRDEGGYGRFEVNIKEDWPPCNHFRSAEVRVRNEPIWQEGGDLREVENGGRVSFGRSSSDRNPIHEQQVGSWDERRLRREVENHIDRGERLQVVEMGRMKSGRRQVGDGTLDHQWCTSGATKRHENLDEKACYRLRRKLCDLDMECDGPGVGELKEGNGGRSCEGIGRVEEQGLFNVHQERRMELKGDGGGFNDQRTKLLLIERGSMIPRHMEQVDHASHHMPPYREVHLPTVISYRDKRSGTSVNERPPTSPELLSDGTDLGRLYRKGDAESYRSPNDISVSHISNNEGKLSDQYPSPKERMSSYGKQYEYSLPHRGYECIQMNVTQNEHNKMAIRQVEMITRPIHMEDEYGMQGLEPRRPSATSEVLSVNAKSQMYPSSRFTANEEGALKDIVGQRDASSQLKPWSLGGHPSVITQTSSPIHKLDNSSEIYMRGRSLNDGDGSWTRDRSREDMPLDWKEVDKILPARGYFGREESNVPETRTSNFNYNLPDRCDKRSSGITPTTIHSEILKNSQSVEKAFSFSSARAAFGQNVYKLDRVTRPPTISGNSTYPRKVSDHFSLTQNISHNVITSTNASADQISNKSFRSSFTQDGSTFIHSPLQGSLKLSSSVAFKQPMPMLSQIPTASYGQGLPSTLHNTIPAAKVGCPWNSKGISPWGECHQQQQRW